MLRSMGNRHHWQLIGSVVRDLVARMRLNESAGAPGENDAPARFPAARVNSASQRHGQGCESRCRAGQAHKARMNVRPSGGIQYRWGSADRLRVSSNDGGALSDSRAK